MSRINLDSITPLRLHLSQRHLGLLEKYRVLDISKADGDTRGITHSVSLHAYDVAVERPRCSPEYELELVVGLDIQTGEFCGRVLEWLGDSRQALLIPIYLQ